MSSPASAPPSGPHEPIGGRDVTRSRAEAGVGRGAARRGDCAGTAPEPRGAALDGGGRARRVRAERGPAAPGARTRGPGWPRLLATSPPAPRPDLRRPARGAAAVHSRAGTARSPTAAPAPRGSRPREAFPGARAAGDARTALARLRGAAPPTPGPAAPSGPRWRPAPRGAPCTRARLLARPRRALRRRRLQCSRGRSRRCAARRAGERGRLGGKEGRGARRAGRGG